MWTLLARGKHSYVPPQKIGLKVSCRPPRANRMDQKVAAEVKKHYTLTDGLLNPSGGTKKWRCNFCKKVVIGSATKLRAHLLGSSGHGVAACPKVCEDAKNAITAAETEDPSNKRKEPAASFGLPSSGSSRQPGIAEVLKKLNKTDIDEAVVAWFYVNAIPFNVVRCGS